MEITGEVRMAGKGADQDHIDITIENLDTIIGEKEALIGRGRGHMM